MCLSCFSGGVQQTTCNIHSQDKKPPVHWDASTVYEPYFAVVCCRFGCGCIHIWSTMVRHRAGGSGCPYCTGRLVCKHRSLAKQNPDLAAQIHPDLNPGVDAKRLAPYSNKRLYWYCSKSHGEHGELGPATWADRICNRSIFGSGCPVCACHH